MIARPTGIALPAAYEKSLAQAAFHLFEISDRILIFAHQHPDADALGSALGLAHVLRGMGKHPVVASPDSPDAIYARFLPDVADVVTTLDGPPFDLVVALDAGDLSRYGDLYERHHDLVAAAPIVNMDHHVTSPGIGAVHIIDTKAAATAELLTLWLVQCGLEIDTIAARCFLAGIITDTRSFEFDATTARTMLVGAYLLERGARPLDIIKPMYRLHSIETTRLNALIMATLGSDCDGRLVWSESTPAMYAAIGVSIGTHDEGVASYLVDIEGTGIAIFFRQVADDQVRLSVRTSGDYDATKLTTRFGGGGHPRAAGCTITADLATAKRDALAVARELLAQ